MKFTKYSNPNRTNRHRTHKTYESFEQWLERRDYLNDYMEANAAQKEAYRITYEDQK